MIEAGRHQVFPLDDRVTERENPHVAGRLDLHHGRTSITFGPQAGRLTEEAAPNVKNRSHTLTVDVDVVGDADSGVLVAQGGRFGGWSLYCARRRPGLRVQLLRPRPDHGARRATAGAGPPRAGACGSTTTAGRPGSGAPRGRCWWTATVGRRRPARGDHGVLLLLRRDVQRRRRPRHPGHRRLPAGAQQVSGRILRVRLDLAPEDPLEVDVRRRVTTLAAD